MYECIICHQSGNLVEYCHCGSYYVHNKCLYEWYDREGYRCFICKKYDDNAYDFFHIFSPKCLNNEKYQLLVFLFLITFYSILSFKFS